MLDELICNFSEIRVGSILWVEFDVVNNFEEGVDDAFAIGPHVGGDDCRAYDVEHSSDFGAV